MEEDTSQGKRAGDTLSLCSLHLSWVWSRPWSVNTEAKKVTLYPLPMDEVEDSLTLHSRVRIRVYHHSRTIFCFLGSYLL